MSKKEEVKKEEVKEEFCGMCIGAGLAIAGAGATGAGVVSKGKHKVSKQIFFWGGIGLLAIALILIFIAWKMSCKKCKG